MYNHQRPDTSELPTSRQLAVSTLAAAAVAALVLVIAILPAEYGFDPTGAGRALGLTQMGEIKTSLAEEALADAAPGVSPEPPAATAVLPTAPASPTQPAVTAPALASAEPQPPAAIAAPLQQDQRSFTLKPGVAVEVKLAMREGAKVHYRWSTVGGALNFDTHGDNPQTSYHGYGKGRGVTSDEGELVAAFDGHHGWFWRNRSPGEVTVTLSVEGDYQAVKRVL